MSWQDWVVAVIILLCVIELFRRVLRFFRPSKENESPCSNCPTGCELKRMMDEKQRDCSKNSKNHKKENKNCCG